MHLEDVGARNPYRLEVASQVVPPVPRVAAFQGLGLWGSWLLGFRAVLGVQEFVGKVSARALETRNPKPQTRNPKP